MKVSVPRTEPPKDGTDLTLFLTLAIGIVLAGAVVLRPYLIARLQRPSPSALTLPPPSSPDVPEEETPSRVTSRKKKKARKKRPSITVPQTASEHANASTTEDDTEIDEPNATRSTPPVEERPIVPEVQEGNEEDDSDPESTRHVRFAATEAPSEAMLRRQAKKAARKAAKAAALAASETLGSLHLIEDLTPAAQNSLERLYEDKQPTPDVPWPAASEDAAATATTTATATVIVPRKAKKPALPISNDPVIEPIWKTATPAVLAPSAPTTTTTSSSSEVAASAATASTSEPAADVRSSTPLRTSSAPHSRSAPSSSTKPVSSGSNSSPLKASKANGVAVAVAADAIASPIADLKHDKPTEQNLSLPNKKTATATVVTPPKSPWNLVAAGVSRSTAPSPSVEGPEPVAPSVTTSDATAHVSTSSPIESQVELPLLSPSIFGGSPFAVGSASSIASSILRPTPSVGVIGGGGAGLGLGLLKARAATPDSTANGTSSSLDELTGPRPDSLRTSLFSSFMKGSSPVVAATRAPDVVVTPPDEEAHLLRSAVPTAPFSHASAPASSNTSLTQDWQLHQDKDDDLVFSSSAADYDELMAEYEAYRRSPQFDQADEVPVTPAPLSYSSSSPHISAAYVSPHASSTTTLAHYGHASASARNLSTPPNGGVAHHPRPPMHIGSGRTTNTATSGINPTFPVPHQWAPTTHAPSPPSSTHYLTPYSAHTGSNHSPSHGSPSLPLSPATTLTSFTNVFHTNANTASHPNSGPNSAMQTPPAGTPTQTTPALKSQLSPNHPTVPPHALPPPSASPTSGTSRVNTPLSHYRAYPPSSNTSDHGAPLHHATHFAPVTTSHYTSVSTPPSVLSSSTISSLSSLSAAQVSQLQSLLASAQAQAAAANINWSDPATAAASIGASRLIPSPPTTGVPSAVHPPHPVSPARVVHHSNSATAPHTRLPMSRSAALLASSHAAGASTSMGPVPHPRSGGAHQRTSSAHTLEALQHSQPSHSSHVHYHRSDSPLLPMTHGSSTSSTMPTVPTHAETLSVAQLAARQQVQLQQAWQQYVQASSTAAARATPTNE